MYYLTLNARELTHPMCFDLSLDARAAFACRLLLASYVFSTLLRVNLPFDKAITEIAFSVQLVSMLTTKSSIPFCD